MVVFRGRGREEGRTTASSRCAQLDGQDDFARDGARWSRAASRGSAPMSARTSWNESFARDAEPRRDRRRQGPALGGARRDAGARPAARRGDLAREADRGGLRPRPQRADSAAARSRRRSSSCSGSATRRTASRSRSTASAATSRARESMFDQLEGVGPVRRRALLQHFGSAERVLEATQEELEGVPGVPAKTARRIYAQLHRTGRA